MALFSQPLNGTRAKCPTPTARTYNPQVGKIFSNAPPLAGETTCFGGRV